jgi:hypothetical protein
MKHLGDLGVDGRIILKAILETVGMCGLKSHDCDQCPAVGSHRQDSEKNLLKPTAVISATGYLLPYPAKRISAPWSHHQ